MIGEKSPSALKIGLIKKFILAWLLLGTMPHAMHTIEPAYAQEIVVVATTTPQIVEKPKPKPSLIDSRMHKIMMCESGGDPNATNLTSSAKGLYQILDETWQDNNCTGNPFNTADNTRCAYKVLKSQGWAAWDASRSCWDK